MGLWGVVAEPRVLGFRVYLCQSASVSGLTTDLATKQLGMQARLSPLMHTLHLRQPRCRHAPCRQPQPPCKHGPGRRTGLRSFQRAPAPVTHLPDVMRGLLPAHAGADGGFVVREVCMHISMPACLMCSCACAACLYQPTTVSTAHRLLSTHMHAMAVGALQQCCQSCPCTCRQAHGGRWRWRQWRHGQGLWTPTGED